MARGIRRRNTLLSFMIKTVFLDLVGLRTSVCRGRVGLLPVPAQRRSVSGGRARFMTVKQGLEQLLEAEAKRKEGILADEVEVVGVARLGREDQKLTFGAPRAVAAEDLGGPLHSLVVCAEELHELEREFLEVHRCAPASAAKSAPAEAAAEPRLSPPCGLSLSALVVPLCAGAGAGPVGLRCRPGLAAGRQLLAAAACAACAIQPAARGATLAQRALAAPSAARLAGARGRGLLLGPPAARRPPRRSAEAGVAG
ncbi:unnamed protein product, partial [Prorocentrum cordatum]